MCHEKCNKKRKIKTYESCFNVYCLLIIISLSVQTVNSNTANMRRFNEKDKNRKQSDSPNSPNSPNEDNYEDHDQIDFTKVNFDNPYYNSEDLLHLNGKFYNNENSAYSNFEDYKKFYLNPSDPVPKSSVKFKISSRIVQTKYGKLQGIVLAMDEHRYLSPLEVFLGVPYATPPVGSNR